MVILPNCLFLLILSVVIVSFWNWFIHPISWYVIESVSASKLSIMKTKSSQPNFPLLSQHLISFNTYQNPPLFLNVGFSKELGKPAIDFLQHSSWSYSYIPFDCAPVFIVEVSVLWWFGLPGLGPGRNRNTF